MKKSRTYIQRTRFRQGYGVASRGQKADGGGPDDAKAMSGRHVDADPPSQVLPPSPIHLRQGYGGQELWRDRMAGRPATQTCRR